MSQTSVNQEIKEAVSDVKKSYIFAIQLRFIKIK